MHTCCVSCRFIYCIRCLEWRFLHDSGSCDFDCICFAAFLTGLRRAVLDIAEVPTGRRNCRRGRRRQWRFSDVDGGDEGSRGGGQVHRHSSQRRRWLCRGRRRRPFYHNILLILNLWVDVKMSGSSRFTIIIATVYYRKPSRSCWP